MTSPWLYTLLYAHFHPSKCISKYSLRLSLNSPTAFLIRSTPSSSRAEMRDSTFVLRNAFHPHDEKQLTLVNGPKKLKPYQVEGIRWLWRLHCKGDGGILADEPGVGKTLQICVFIVSLFNSGLTQRVLVVVPATVLQDWCDAFKELGMSAHVYHGTAKEKQLKLVLEDAGILVTTYDTLVHNIDSLTRMWNYLILDEGHIIKNLKTKRSEFLRRIPADHRLVITGTPIQNTIDEIWSLLNYCLPQRFSDLKEFQETRSKPLERGKNKHVKDDMRLHYFSASEDYFSASEKLKSDIEPYVLRRTKEEVLVELPKKLEFTVWLRLTAFQRHLYEKFVKDAKFAISRAPLAAIEVLKKLCDDPILVQMGEQKNEENELGQDKDKGASKRLLSKMYAIMRKGLANNQTFESCKLLFLESFVPNMCKEGHNVLIFSRRKHMLNRIQEILNPLLPFKCGRLDGDISSKNRTKIIK